MGSSSTDQILSQAFALIESNKQGEAKTLLQPLLDGEKDNPDVWWVYAHAVSDADEARDALNTVLLLEPNYPGATDLLQTLRSRAPDSGSIARPKSLPSSLPESGDIDDIDFESLDDSLGDADDWDDEFLEDDEPESRPKRPRYLRILVPLIVIVIIVAFAAILLMNPTPSASPAPSATPTVSGQSSPPTDAPPTPTVSPAITEETTGTSQSADATDFDAFESAFSAFNVPNDGIEMLTTGLGDTLVVTICYPEGATSDDVLLDAMRTLASQSNNVGDDVDAMAINIYDCEQDATPRIIAVTVNEAQSYLNGEIDDRAYQDLWKLQDTR